MKTVPATAEIPVFIVTITDNQSKGFALGAAEYLVKPIRKEMLLTALQKHLRKDATALRVLAVDDEPASLQVAEEILLSAGYECVTAQNGRQALQRLAVNRVDAILLDLLMPEMDGFELLRALAENESMRRIPVFVVTSKELSTSEEEFLTQASQGIFLKATSSWKEEVLRQLNDATRASVLSRSN